MNKVALFSVILQTSRRRRRPRDFTNLQNVYKYFPGSTLKEKTSIRKALDELHEVRLIHRDGTTIKVLGRKTQDANPLFPKYVTAVEALAGLEPIDESEQVRPVFSRPTRDVRQFGFRL